MSRTILPALHPLARLTGLSPSSRPVGPALARSPGRWQRFLSGLLRALGTATA
jgi:hypothetical protein